MFNDERINIERGKAYKTSVLILLIILIPTLGYKLMLLRHHTDLFRIIITSLFEIIGIITCLLFLLFGAINVMDVERDERYEFVKYEYYEKNLKYVLIVLLIAYSISLPFSYVRFNNMTNLLLMTIELSLYIHFSYKFKTNDITFNYSFIDNSKSNYYKKVFIRIAIIIGVVFLMYLVSFLIGYFILRLPVLLTFIYQFIVNSFSITISYLILSIFEKMHYDEESSNKAFKKTAILALVFIFLISILKVILLFVMTKGVRIFNLNLGDSVAFLTYISNGLSYYSTVVFIMTICFLFNDIRSDKKSFNGLKAYIIISLIIRIEYFISSLIIDFIAPLISPQILTQIALCKNYISLFITDFMYLILLYVVIRMYKSNLTTRNSPIIFTFSLTFAIIISALSFVINSTYLSIISFFIPVLIDGVFLYISSHLIKEDISLEVLD